MHGPLNRLNHLAWRPGEAVNIFSQIPNSISQRTLLGFPPLWLYISRLGSFRRTPWAFPFQNHH